MTSGVRKKQNKKDCKYEEPDGRIKFRCCKEPLIYLCMNWLRYNMRDFQLT